MVARPSHQALLAFLAALFSGGASAQVGFLVDVMTTHMCIANNWQTPSWQAQFAQLSAGQKAKLRRDLEIQFSPQAVECLEKSRPYPESICAKVIDKARGGMPAVGGGEPFLGKDLEKALEAGSAQAFQCLEQKMDPKIS